MIFTGHLEIKRVLWNIDAMRRMIDDNHDIIELALCAADVERIVAKGKIAVILHLTNCAIDDDLAVLRAYHGLGVRAIQIAFNYDTPTWVDSCYSPRTEGLTAFGEEVIHEMNRLGMLVDLAHASDTAYAKVIDTSKQPVYSSHSGARARCNMWRNLTDETLRHLASRDGLVGAFFGSNYLDPYYWDQEAALALRTVGNERVRALAERYADDPFALALALRTPAPETSTAGSLRARPKSSPISALLDHLDHFVEVIGDDYVCLGSDFGGIGRDGVIGLDEPSKMPNLTAAVLARGWSHERTQKVLGTNLLNLFRTVTGG